MLEKTATDQQIHTTHHATLLIGQDFRTFAVLEPHLAPGPDTHHIIKDALTIDDVREVIVRALSRPVQGKEVVFIIAVRSVNHEAQHALLKILEEPPRYVRIFLVVPIADQLLPTVRSRLSIHNEEVLTQETNEVFSTFAALSYADRLALVTEKTKTKDLDWIDAVVKGSEVYVNTDLAAHTELLRAVVVVQRYRSLRGASQKMLLEELALKLPTA